MTHDGIGTIHKYAELLHEYADNLETVAFNRTVAKSVEITSGAFHDLGISTEQESEIGNMLLLVMILWAKKHGHPSFLAFYAGELLTKTFREGAQERLEMEKGKA